MQLALRFDGRLDVIFLAGGNTAGGQKQIMIGGGSAQLSDHTLTIVGQDAEIGDPATEPLKQGTDSVAVGIVDAARLRGLPRLLQFVAGRKQRDAKPLRYLKVGAPGRRRETDVLRPQPLSGAQYRFACRNVFSGEAPVAALLDTGADHHGIALKTAVLLHHHGVRPVGHQGAGEDANCLPATSRPAQRMPRGRAACDRQTGVRLRLQIGEVHGIAVNGGVVLCRNGDGGHDVLTQHPAQGLGQSHALYLADRADACLQQGQRLIQAHQAPAVGEAIVAELRHQATPWRRAAPKPQ